MPLTQSPTIERFWDQGEQEISVECSFLVDRLSLALVAGQSTYILPDYVSSIRRVTHLGWKCDPLPQRNFREVFQSAMQKGKPYWYIYNNIGQNKVSLFPSPDQSLAVVPQPWSSDPVVGSSAGCVVEFYRVTDNQNFILPLWTRRQMLKQYVARRVFAQDGAQGSFKMRDYYIQKWNNFKAQFVEMVEFLYMEPRKLVINEIVSSNYFPGEPVLPINQFGVSVDEGY